MTQQGKPRPSRAVPKAAVPAKPDRRHQSLEDDLEPAEGGTLVVDNKSFQKQLAAKDDSVMPPPRRRSATREAPAAARPKLAVAVPHTPPGALLEDEDALDDRPTGAWRDSEVESTQPLPLEDADLGEAESKTLPGAQRGATAAPENTQPRPLLFDDADEADPARSPRAPSISDSPRAPRTAADTQRAPNHEGAVSAVPRRTASRENPVSRPRRPDREARGASLAEASDDPATSPSSPQKPKPGPVSARQSDGQTLESPEAGPAESTRIALIPSPVSKAEVDSAPSRQAGAYSRKQSNEPKAAVPRASLTQTTEPEPELKPMDPAAQRRLIVAGGVIASLLALAIISSLFLSTARPVMAELRLLYPYGFANTPLAGGVVRPGAYEVEFEYLGPTACIKDSSSDCLLYEYSGGRFSGRMVVRPSAAGWERVDAAPEATPP